MSEKVCNEYAAQCFAKAKPFRLKKSQKKPNFVWLLSIFKKSQVR